MLIYIIQNFNVYYLAKNRLVLYLNILKNLFNIAKNKNFSLFIEIKKTNIYFIAFI